MRGFSDRYKTIFQINTYYAVLEEGTKKAEKKYKQYKKQKL